MEKEREPHREPPPWGGSPPWRRIKEPSGPIGASAAGGCEKATQMGLFLRLPLAAFGRGALFSYPKGKSQGFLPSREPERCLHAGVCFPGMHMSTALARAPSSRLGHSSRISLFAVCRAPLLLLRSSQIWGSLTGKRNEIT